MSQMKKNRITVEEKGLGKGARILEERLVKKGITEEEKGLGKETKILEEKIASIPKKRKKRVRKSDFKIVSSIIEGSITSIHLNTENGNDNHKDIEIILDPRLKSNLDNLCSYLIDNNLVNNHIRYTQGIRDPKIAHKWSTAYNIKKYFSIPSEKDLVKYKISKEKFERRRKRLLGNLKKLNQGKDIDKNLWYEKDWDRQKIIENAQAILDDQNITGPAAEGYPKECPRRLPNLPGIGVTNHLRGNAIDATIRWKTGKGIDRKAKNLVKKFGLVRPVKTEKWHFELPENDRTKNREVEKFDFSKFHFSFDFDFTDAELEQK